MKTAQLSAMLPNNEIKELIWKAGLLKNVNNIVEFNAKILHHLINLETAKIGRKNHSILLIIGPLKQIHCHKD